MTDGIKFQSSDNAVDAIIQPIKISSGAMNLFLGSNAVLNTAGSIVRFDTSTASAYVNIRSSDGQIQMATSGTGANPANRMVIDSAGNVGINASTPGTLLHAQAGYDGVVLRLQDTDGTCDFSPESSGAGPACSCAA